MGKLKSKPAAQADKDQSVVLEPTISSLEAFIAANGDRKLKSVKAELIGMVSQIKGNKPREVKHIFSETNQVLAIKDYLTGLWVPIEDKEHNLLVGSHSRHVGGVSNMSKLSTSRRLKLVEARREKEIAAKELLIHSPPKTKEAREKVANEPETWFISATAQEAQSQLDNMPGKVFATREDCIAALKSWGRRPDPAKTQERVK